MENTRQEFRMIALTELEQANFVLNDFIESAEGINSIVSASEIMIKCLKSGGKIIACGNGGSMSDAMHFCSELTGRYRKDRPPIAAIAISDPGHVSCVSNDYGYDEVFARYVSAHGKPGDVLLAISTSGNSKNVAHAIGTALEHQDMNVVFLTGQTGGHISSSLSHFIKSEAHHRYQPIHVPHEGSADRIQEVHIKIIHILVRLIEKGLGYDV